MTSETSVGGGGEGGDGEAGIDVETGEQKQSQQTGFQYSSSVLYLLTFLLRPITIFYVFMKFASRSSLYSGWQVKSRNLLIH